jgi:hypothetical protein
MSKPKVVAGKAVRRLPKAGDFLRITISDSSYRFGRVIKDDVVIGPFRNGWLVYVYANRSDTQDLPDDLRKDNLLVAPLIVNQSPWAKGLFQPAGHAAIRSTDLWPTHCFQHSISGKYFDEYSNEVAGKYAYVGDFALKFDRAVESTLNTALAG